MRTGFIAGFSVRMLSLPRGTTEVSSVIIVHLRRPGSRNDKRSDPFWEFGSFGITGCHERNLLSLRNAEKLDGVRLAFAQGGPKGTRLVHLTPPVKIIPHQHYIEAQWSP